MNETEDAIAVPRALLTELANAASDSERPALASQAFDLLPKQPTRIRVVNLDTDDSMIVGDDRLYVDATESTDPMVAIEMATRLWCFDNRIEPPEVPDLLDFIRTALEEAAR